MPKRRFGLFKRKKNYNPILSNIMVSEKAAEIPALPAEIATSNMAPPPFSGAAVILNRSSISEESKKESRTPLPPESNPVYEFPVRRGTVRLSQLSDTPLPPYALVYAVTPSSFIPPQLPLPLTPALTPVQAPTPSPSSVALIRKIRNSFTPSHHNHHLLPPPPPPPEPSDIPTRPSKQFNFMKPRTPTLTE